MAKAALIGLCRQCKSSSCGELKPPRPNTQFRGTARYASLAAHREEELYPRDDLESWLYVVVEFMIGSVQGIPTYQGTVD